MGSVGDGPTPDPASPETAADWTHSGDDGPGGTSPTGAVLLTGACRTGLMGSCPVRKLPSLPPPPYPAAPSLRLQFEA